MIIRNNRNSLLSVLVIVTYLAIFGKMKVRGQKYFVSLQYYYRKPGSDFVLPAPYPAVRIAVMFLLWWICCWEVLSIQVVFPTHLKSILTAPSQTLDTAICKARLSREAKLIYDFWLGCTLTKQ